MPTSDTKRLRELALLPGYRSGTDDLVRDFYLPCLGVATRYNRAVGYFRSSLFILAGLAFSDFALRRGRMRLVCSPHMAPDDVSAIREGEHVRDSGDLALLESVEQCLRRPEEQSVVAFLATLVSHGTLEFRIAYRPGETGIYHNKVGVFEDCAHDQVSFVGSANETYSAWSIQANHEGFEVFRSWASSPDRERLDRHVRYFEALWNGNEPGLRVVPVPDAVDTLLESLADPEGLDAAAEKVRRVVRDSFFEHAERRPNIVLQDHQRTAVESWRAAGARGILKQATGAGKTITALEIAREWTAQGNPCLVLVPSDLLASQWRLELLRFFSTRPHILEVGGSQSDRRWREYVSDFTREDNAIGSRLIVATMASAATSDFRDRLRDTQQLLVIADEVHRIGSQMNSRLLEIEAGGRLGLSATPERYGDPAGTARIFSYFGDILRPEFTIADAVRAGRLVEYDYYPHVVELNTSELDAWRDLTTRIRREFARLPVRDGAKIMTDYYKHLLIKRARILKKATAKTALAREILLDQFRPGDRWLVYCDDLEQLSAVLLELRTLGLPAFEYHSSMAGPPDETIARLTEAGGVLVAIRCLDEGVDIPSVNAALILASSRNPREFIQRRGRVLRTSPGKYSARVFDALVVPQRDQTPSEDERAAVAAELSRALEFAATARNASARRALEILAMDYGLGSMASGETTSEEGDE